jgi:hypothetical protein
MSNRESSTDGTARSAILIMRSFAKVRNEPIISQIMSAEQESGWLCSSTKAKIRFHLLRRSQS